jgi:hypothetical protein
MGSFQVGHNVNHIFLRYVTHMLTTSYGYVNSFGRGDGIHLRVAIRSADGRAAELSNVTSLPPELEPFGVTEHLN